MSTLMRVRSVPTIFEPRVGLTVQFLDGEIESLADLAPFEQSFDFIEMRLQAPHFLGHVDADGEAGPTRRGPVRPSGGQRLRPGPGFLPSLEEAPLLLARQQAAPGRGFAVPGPAIASGGLQHGCQPGAFLLPGVSKGRCSGLFGQRRDGFGPSPRSPRPGRCTGAGPATLKGWPGGGSQRAHRILRRLRLLQHAAMGREGTRSRRFPAGRTSTLPRLIFAVSRIAQHGFHGAQFVGRRNERSRKRLLTDGSPVPGAAGAAGPRLRCSRYPHRAGRWRIRSCCKLALDF